MFKANNPGQVQLLHPHPGLLQVKEIKFSGVLDAVFPLCATLEERRKQRRKRKKEKPSVSQTLSVKRKRERERESVCVCV